MVDLTLRIENIYFIFRSENREKMTRQLFRTFFINF